MNDLAIKVDGISKSYVIDRYSAKYKTLREMLYQPVVLWGADKMAKTKVWALRDVSFDVGKGEIVGLIGRNGAGKTTILKVLSKITSPSSGSATVQGRVGSLLEVGTGFHPELTGKENIYLNGVILGMGRSEIDRKFDEIVAFSEVEKFLNTPVKYYSSGMYVRLAFAVAAFLDSEILFVDEVLAVGDAAFQEKCIGKMGDIAKQGRTILFVSHNMAAIRQLCDRVLLIDNGKVAFDETPENAIKKYLSIPDNDAKGAEINTDSSVKRAGTGPNRITKVILENNSGEKVREFAIGEKFSVSIFFDVKEKMENPVVGVDVRSSWGWQLINIRSDSQNIMLGPFKEGTKAKVKINIPGIPFYPGTYILEPWISTKGRKKQDQIHDDIRISIRSEGNYQSEMLIEQGKGIMVMDCGWDNTVLNESEEA